MPSTTEITVRNLFDFLILSFISKSFTIPSTTNAEKTIQYKTVFHTAG